MQTLTDLLETIAHDGDELTAEIDDVWLQGRSMYGGLQAALAAEAMRPHGGGLELRTLQVTFCAPVPCGHLRITTRPVRAGKNTRHVEARIVSDDQTLALFVGIFARARPSAVSKALTAPASIEKPGRPMPYVEGLTPEFLNHFEAAIVEGHLPGSGVPDESHLFRVSLRDKASMTGLAQLLTLADFPPPIALSWLPHFAPGSTMTWMLTFTGHPFEDQPLKDWIFKVDMDNAHDGYTHQTVTLFAPNGQAILRGSQCMTIFG